MYQFSTRSLIHASDVILEIISSRLNKASQGRRLFNVGVAFLVAGTHKRRRPCNVLWASDDEFLLTQLRPFLKMVGAIYPKI